MDHFGVNSCGPFEEFLGSVPHFWGLKWVDAWLGQVELLMGGPGLEGVLWEGVPDARSQGLRLSGLSEEHK